MAKKSAKKKAEKSTTKSKKSGSRNLTSHRTWSGFIEVEAFESRSKTISVPLGVALKTGATAIAALQRTQGDTTPYWIESSVLSLSAGTHSLTIVIEWSGVAPQRSYVVYYVSGVVLS